MCASTTRALLRLVSSMLPVARIVMRLLIIMKRAGTLIRVRLRTGAEPTVLGEVCGLWNGLQITSRYVSDSVELYFICFWLNLEIRLGTLTATVYRVTLLTVAPTPKAGGHPLPISHQAGVISTRPLVLSLLFSTVSFLHTTCSYLTHRFNRQLSYAVPGRGQFSTVALRHV